MFFRSLCRLPFLSASRCGAWSVWQMRNRASNHDEIIQNTVNYCDTVIICNNTMAAMQSLSTPWCPASLRESKAYWKASKSRGGFCDHHSSRISTAQRTDSMMESHNPIFGSNGLDLAGFYWSLPFWLSGTTCVSAARPSIFLIRVHPRGRISVTWVNCNLFVKPVLCANGLSKPIL